MVEEGEKTTEKEKTEDIAGDVKNALEKLAEKAPEGAVTIDENVAIECDVLSYEAIFEIVLQISEDIIQENPNSVIICDQNDLNSLLSYHTYINQINILKRGYEETIAKEEVPMVKAEEAVTLATLLSAAIPALPNIIALFKKDVEIRGKSFGIIGEDLIADVARILRLKGVTTIYPAFLQSDIKSILVTSLIELLGARSKANQKIEEWSKKDELKDRVAWLRTLNENYDNMLKSFSVVDEKTGSNGLARLIKGEVLSTKLNEEGTYILYLKVVAAGGNIKITEGFLSKKFSYSGGAIITYFLLDKGMGIIASKTLYNTTGYKKFKKDSEGESRLKNFELIAEHKCKYCSEKFENFLDLERHFRMQHKASLKLRVE